MVKNMTEFVENIVRYKLGGEGSGYFGHSGRPGEIGGSGEGGTEQISGGKTGKSLFKLQVGQEVTWKGVESKHGDSDWLRKGMKGYLVQYHPKVKGTGRIIDYEEDGTPIRDVGIEAWWKVDFGKAGTRAISEEDLQDRLSVD